MKYRLMIYGLLLSLKIIAQTDSIFVERDDSITQINPDDKIYRLFIEDKTREIRHLFKVNLISLSLVNLNIGYEQRLGRNWSSDTYLGFGNPDQGILSYETIKWYSENGIQPYAFGVGLSQDIKFYYNLQRRQRLGKRYRGFSGNYFGLRIGGYYSLSKLKTDSYDASTSYRNAGANLIYGLQRRIGNIGYVAIFTGIGGYYYYSRAEITEIIEYDPENRIIILEDLEFTGPFIGISAGFAIDSFKNLRRMLKD